MIIRRPEDVPGYSKNCRDMTKFEEAARALRVSPFYHGSDCVPLSRLRRRVCTNRITARASAATTVGSSGSRRRPASISCNVTPQPST